MSHHYSGPEYGFPHGDARLDLTDLYAFPKPGDGDKSILIMNVHPSVGVNSPGPTTREPFATEALYELKIDTDGDAVADIAYRVSFSPLSDGTQVATVAECANTATRFASEHRADLDLFNARALDGGSDVFVDLLVHVDYGVAVVIFDALE